MGKNSLELARVGSLFVSGFILFHSAWNWLIFFTVVRRWTLLGPMLFPDRFDV